MLPSRLLLRLTLLLASACGAASDPVTGRGPTEVDAPPVIRPVSRIDLAPGSITLTEGERTSVVAIARAADGSALSGRVIVLTADDSAVAAVSSAGEIVARRAGNTALVARSEGVEARIPLVVRGAAVGRVRVELSASILWLAPSGHTTLRARVLDEAGREVANPDLTWTSSDPGVVLVDRVGNVLAVASGEAMVSVAGYGVRREVRVVVQRDGAWGLLSVNGVPGADLDTATVPTTGGVGRLATLRLRRGTLDRTPDGRSYRMWLQVGYYDDYAFGGPLLLFSRDVEDEGTFAYDFPSGEMLFRSIRRPGLTFRSEGTPAPGAFQTRLAIPGVRGEHVIAWAPR